MSDTENEKGALSRRRLLKKTVAAAAGGAALLAQAGAFAQPPAAITKRRFKAWISRGDGPGRTTLQEAVLRPIAGRQVLVRTEATNLCYSNVPTVLGVTPPGAAAPRPGGVPPTARPGGLASPPGARRLADMAVIQGHGGVGVVEAVGPEVRRVQVGDRVCVSGTPQCGSCYRCLRGRSDMCQFLSANGADDLVAMADLADGTPV
ncbi:MAG TPA: alcohol dehydrogenase catalytic domain-containing protein, partial [Gammaproteobacteria bacterium]|nr:alcohol dehydrogenase catalytic domain-containing protein [Gammaproteobacteria bacterium]